MLKVLCFKAAHRWASRYVGGRLHTYQSSIAYVKLITYTRKMCVVNPIVVTKQ